ncbi:hypothetical protein [Aerococcus christensenii]|uniref:hypothetical protein n=1 Tax=Aerococcus christensenii TaxID=87541 RepID=UPI0023A9FDC9|nr:hypothetical protein [Aerococcus christensenii]WEB70257.1 hypothetical protein PUW42_04105 [Aerococcus christensenii]WEB70258.1 hypothetical protein PUW42_04110 [Aerococcus christensenii]
MKIDPLLLFCKEYDVRQYCHIDMFDNEKKKLCDEYDIDNQLIDLILSKSRIFVTTNLPKAIDVIPFALMKR